MSRCWYARVVVAEKHHRHDIVLYTKETIGPFDTIQYPDLVFDDDVSDTACASLCSRGRCLSDHDRVALDE